MQIYSSRVKNYNNIQAWHILMNQKMNVEKVTWNNDILLELFSIDFYSFDTEHAELFLYFINLNLHSL